VRRDKKKEKEEKEKKGKGWKKKEHPMLLDNHTTEIVYR